MSSTLYTPDILRLALATAAVPRLDRPDGSVELRAPLCGSRVTVDVTLATGLVTAVGLDVRACAMGQASAALLAQAIVGKSETALASTARALKLWLSGDEASAPDWPGITALAPARAYPARHGAILIPFEAAAAAAREALALAA